jgi:hypothetical protein
MSSKSEVLALEIMSGAHGTYLLGGASLYTPPVGYAIGALIPSADSVIASALKLKDGYVVDAGLTAAAVLANVTYMFPQYEPILSITLTSGTVTLYFCKLQGLPKYSNVATAAGLTTGAILATSRNLKVTSPSAASVCCLPTTGASTVGLTINGWIGANGFELRPIAAQANTVYINDVTTGVEAAIPAQSEFLIKCTDATHWTLKVWDSQGQPRAAIVPDAI